MATGASSRMDGLNSKHHKKGDSCPDLDLKDGKIALFNMRWCPYAERTVLVCLAKSIPTQVVNCRLRFERPEFLADKNPDGKVPVIEQKDGTVLAESLIVNDFLDETYPGPKLNPACQTQRAKDRWTVERSAPAFTNYYKVVNGGGDAEEEAKFLANVDVIEGELARRGTAYFAGREKPGMIDYNLWPWFERFPILAELAPGATLKEERFPLLMAWCDKMRKDPVVSQALISVEDHARYTRLVREGARNYDLICE